ncbi:GerAB/ArcD/ProY family transporter [Oceanobacillus picturae]|uniref:GerAB/ArcD/ProY family transporter n=1 Tax=Oceanobacillus picturae TaxID=171693 RepID=UPI00362D6C59
MAVKSFKYADEKISDREVMVAIPSMVIGVGILSLPKNLATVTTASDGWIPLLLGGIIAVFMTWVVAKFAAGFPNQTFLTYATTIVSRPIAIVLSFLFVVIFVSITALQVREIAAISKQYIFDRTPLEVIALAFLLVVLYGVSGSRAGLFRLNIMFLPIILFVALIVFIFNIGWFEFGNLLPTFTTSFSGYTEALNTSVTSYLGFSILWFYIGLMDQPKKAPKLVALGMCIPVVLYLLLFILCIGVFGQKVTANILYPTVELAKVVDIPGGFFERFESVFFVIWIMAIFNTTAMALDVAVLVTTSIFKKTVKIKVLLILAPIVYLVSMFPQDVTQISAFSSFIGNTTFIYTVFIAVLLIVMAKARGVKRYG